MILSQVQKGADFTKVMVNGGGATPGTSCLELQFSYEQVLAISAESHRLKRKVAAHVDCAAAIEMSAQAGVDTLEHCEFLTPQGLEIDEKILALLVDREVSIVPTLSGWYAVRDKVDCWSTLSQLQHSFREYWEEVVAVTKRFKQVGLRLIAGSDAGIPEVAHDSLLLEIELLHCSGLSPMEAIQAATGSAAQALGIDEDRGSIQPGKRADLLVVQGDPLEDLKALRKPLLILKDGEVLRHTQTR
jgi:imidazolonepropionase-like amidohydrolase